MEINSRQNTRIFLALPVDEKYHKAITELQSELMLDLEHLPHSIRWTQPQRLHLTLFFLGRHSQRTIQRLVKELTKIDFSALPPIEFFCNQIQLFPQIKPTVVALTGKTHSSLKLLRESVGHCLEKANIHPDLSIESHGFLPHITLGKLEEPTDFKTQPTKISLHFNELILFKSEPIEPPRSPYVTHTALCQRRLSP